jgi:thioredoxin-dependent peroxiredoxin
LREDFDRFRQAGATIIAIAPDTTVGVARFVRDNEYPFPLLADKDHAVFDAYDVANKLMSLGQRPAAFVVDRSGIIRLDAVGTQQWQIVPDDKVLAVLSSL